jgi:hypothetical protein
MTLHEQYKEDTEPHPFLKNKGHVKILMKKAYLNSIDCMIDRHMKKAILPPLGGEPDYDEGEYIQSSIHIEELNYLRKQRELIANRNTDMSCLGCEECSGGDENLQEYNDKLKV